MDQRLVDQIQLVVDALPEAAAYPPDWRDTGVVEYLYREGCLLARDPDAALAVGAVARELGLRPIDPDDPDDADAAARARGGDVPDGRMLGESAFQGLTRLRYRRAGDDDARAGVPDLLARLDEPQFGGIGTVRPESVLYVCPHACPATEPMEVPEATDTPFPAPPVDCGCAPACDGEDVLVSVVDTGWIEAAGRRPWLHGVRGDVENPWKPGEQQPQEEEREIRDYGGHGTFVAGCVRVTAPKAQVYVDGALVAAGAAYETDLVNQLAQALDRSPDVVVFTFATRTRLSLSLPGFDALYESVIRPRKGLVVLAPAGNDGVRDVMWPAAYPWVVSVGALAANWRQRASFSNFGGWVDVYAPGDGLVNAFATGTYTCREHPDTGVERVFRGMARWSGTSFSTPLVAGMVAARMSQTGENGQQAAAALLRLARSQTIHGVGPVLLPGQACDDAG
ncbi:MAG: S8 family peptidase [Pseudonocardia sp.]